LLHVHADAGLEARLQAAIDLARANDGHVCCVQVTPPYEHVTADAFGELLVLPADIEQIRDLQVQERRLIEARLTRENIAWGWLRRDGDVARCLLRASHLSDLIIASLNGDHEDEPGRPLPIAAEVAVGARCPVLAMPTKQNRLILAGTAAVAWDGSPQAAHALRAALPFLDTAQSVHLLTVEEKAKESSYPAIEASSYLSRYGIASLLHQVPARGSVEESLLAAVSGLGADLLVMGAFGHGSLRKMILGGVTRYILHEAQLPLLLCH
jgi:nucleotide-binding universal stress UspA family protein